MILTNVAGLKRYTACIPGLDKVLAFLAANDMAVLPNGRIEIDGDDVYCNVSAYETRTGDVIYEAHRSYLDIQLIAAGREKMAYAPLEALKLTKAYDVADDCCLGTAAGDFFNAPAGTVAVFFPEDAHAPCLAIDGTPEKVKKCVFKVKAAD